MSKGSFLDADSFPILIDRLIRDLYSTAEEMGAETDLGWSTISRWRRGKMRAVSEYSVGKLCDATRLSRTAVWRILDRDRDRRRNKQPIPLPDTSDVGPGPRTKQEIEEFHKRRKNSNGLRKLGAAIILGAAMAAMPGTSEAAPQPAPDGQPSAPYRKLRLAA